MDFRDDKEVMETFIEEAGDRVSEIESGLLDLERSGLEVDPEVVHSAFRAAHSIKATANLLNFKHIGELSHKMENILEMFRNQELVPDGQVVAVGGRVLNVTARGASLGEARKKAYAMAEAINWPEGFYRSDIGWRALDQG